MLITCKRKNSKGHRDAMVFSSVNRTGSDMKRTPLSFDHHTIVCFFRFDAKCTKSLNHHSDTVGFLYL